MAATVLVVDGQEAVRSVIARYLGEQGYAATTARDGGAALEALDRSWPDVVVADAAILRRGDQALALRLRDGNRAVPLVVLAGSAGACPWDGAACLVKPFDVGALAEAVAVAAGVAEAAPLAAD